MKQTIFGNKAIFFTPSKMFGKLILVASIFTSVLANSAYPATKCGTLQVTFDTCIDNALIGANGEAYNTISEACTQFEAVPPGQFAYYQCLCQQAQRIITW